MYDPASGQFAPNSWHGSFPVGRGLPARPNPLARELPTQTVKADINGVQQAMNKRAESCGGSMNRSAAGESNLKYKVGDDDLKKGEEAFKTLDNYMKKAGLNSFQINFFGRLMKQGKDEKAIRNAVASAIAKFGEKVSKDLNEGLEKLSAGESALVNPLLNFFTRLGTRGSNFVKGFKAAPGAMKPETLSALKATPGAADLANVPRTALPFEYADQTGKAFASGAALRNMFKLPNFGQGGGSRGGGLGLAYGALNPFDGAMGNLYDENGNPTLSSVSGGLLQSLPRLALYGLLGRAAGQLPSKAYVPFADAVARGINTSFIGGIGGGVTDRLGLTEGAGNIGSTGGFLLGAGLTPAARYARQGIKAMNEGKYLFPEEYNVGKSFLDLGRQFIPTKGPLFRQKGIGPLIDDPNVIKYPGGVNPITGKPQFIHRFYSKYEPTMGSQFAKFVKEKPFLSNAIAAQAPLMAASVVGGTGRTLSNLATMPARAEQAIAQAQEAAQNVNNLTANAQQTLTPFQNLSNYYQQNQNWLNPLLGALAGGAGGYLLGGTPGAVAGGTAGLSLPMLLSLLSAGQGQGQENPLAALFGSMANSPNYFMRKALTDRLATSLPDELARQRAQQQAQFSR